MLASTTTHATTDQEPGAGVPEARQRVFGPAGVSHPWRFRLFLGIRALTTLVTGWQMLSGERRFDQASTLMVLLALFACTAAFLWWLPGPVLPETAGATRSRRGLFTLLVLLAALLLFPLRTLIGPPCLFGLPVIAILTLATLRRRPGRREVRYALSLAALVAAGLLAGYRFAYLHTPGGPAAIPSTLFLGTLYSLPITFLWLRRGLETAIGLHFCVDFVRFGAAYLGIQGWLAG